jgi:putative membrane protein
LAIARISGGSPAVFSEPSPFATSYLHPARAGWSKKTRFGSREVDRMFGAGFCNGMGVGGWVLMIGFWVAILGLVVWGLTRIFPSDAPLRATWAELDRRLAAGEIDPATYRGVRDELTGSARR